MTDKEFSALLETAPPNMNIQKYMCVTRDKLSEYSRIAVSYSGGSDSDTIIDLIELVKPEDSGEVRYVFFDTGLEFDATHRHVEETEKQYGISIERRKAKVSIPVACKQYGVPFISKDVSEMLNRLQKHDFNYKETPEGATTEKYGRCKSALDWYFNRRKPSKNEKNKFSIANYYMLKEYLIAYPPDFTISDKCCDYAKKDVQHDYLEEYKPDLDINGMRQAEGGRRTGSITSCFSAPNDKQIYARFMPLWFWTDEDKRIYKEWRGLRYSDCYEKWGFKRTGCVGCPCNSAAVEQLEIAKQYEPQKVKAAYAVFGRSYEYRERYNRFKKYGDQISMDEIT